MRKPVAIAVLLVLFGFVPIGAWAAMALSLDPAGMGRSLGMAILVLLAPLGFAGMLMILGAALLERTRCAGRIFATAGAAIVVAGVGFFSAMWLERVGHCGEASRFGTDRLVEGGGLLVYALAHIGLIVLLWRGRTKRGEWSLAA